MKEIKSNTIVTNNILYYTIHNNNMKEIRSNTIVTNNIVYYTTIIWKK